MLTFILFSAAFKSGIAGGALGVMITNEYKDEQLAKSTTIRQLMYVSIFMQNPVCFHSYFPLNQPILPFILILLICVIKLSEFEIFVNGKDGDRKRWRQETGDNKITL